MRRRQFTLIEVMIVVAIIALLAMIALPSFIQARRSARTTTCIANLRMIEGAKGVWIVLNNAAEDAVMTVSDLEPHFIRATGRVSCPLGTSFDDSYDIGSPTVLATCKKAPDIHTL